MNAVLTNIVVYQKQACDDSRMAKYTVIIILRQCHSIIINISDTGSNIPEDNSNTVTTVDKIMYSDIIILCRTINFANTECNCSENSRVLVLGFRDNIHTMTCAGALPFRREFSATTRSSRFGPLQGH